MGTVRLGAFPSLNNKGLQDDVAKAIMEWFVHFFPNRFFNHLFLDTQVSNASSYIINEQTGEFIKAEPGQKILQPSLRINVKQGANNPQDVWGSLWNVNQQPGAFTIDTDLTGYKPFVYDPNGVIIATNEYTIKNNIEITVSLQTKADQLAFYNICDTNIKNLYVTVIDANVGIILPSLLMQYLRDVLFARELKLLTNMLSDDEEKTRYRTKINDMFAEWLYTWSNKCIKPVVEKDENGVKNYIYKLFRKQRLTIRLDKPDGDEGNKKGGAYSGFSVNFSGYVEYANPITFISQVPAILRGMKNDYFIRTSSNTDNKANYRFMEFKEVFKDNRRLVFVDGTRWDHFYFEREIMMAKTTENFNMIGEVITEKDTPSHYYIINALMTFIHTKEEFNNLFQIIIYKNNDPVRFTVDEKFNITIENCDLNVPYYIDVFVSKAMYKNYMERVQDILYRNGIIIDPFESNHHRNGYLISDNPTHKHGVDPEYVDKIHSNNRGYFYLTRNEEGYDKNRSPEMFVPIKPQHFTQASEEWVYYIVSTDGIMIPVENKIVEQRDDLQYYILDDGEYVKIRRESVLIPVKGYTYYIFDKYTRQYTVCENLEQFDPKTQYYIPFSQHRSPVVDADELK